MIRGVAILLGFQFVGEVATRLGQLPVSGPIFGMAALLVWLLLKAEIDGDLGQGRLASSPTWPCCFVSTGTEVTKSVDRDSPPPQS